jgi:hypothetical protein
MYFLQVTEVIQAAKGLESDDLFWILIFAMFSILALAAIPIVKSIIEYFKERDNKIMKFDHTQKELDRQLERENKREKFDRENKIADALMINAKNLEESTKANAKLADILKEQSQVNIDLKNIIKNDLRSVCEMLRKVG